MATLLYADVLLAGKTSEGNARETKEQKRRGRRAREKVKRVCACVWGAYRYRRNWFSRRPRRAIILYRKSPIGRLRGWENESQVIMVIIVININYLICKIILIINLYDSISSQEVDFTNQSESNSLIQPFFCSRVAI